MARATNPGSHVACGSNLTAKECRQLQHTYESARASGVSKQRAAQQAWGAVGRSMNPPTPQRFANPGPNEIDVVWSPVHSAYAITYGKGPVSGRQVLVVDSDPGRIQWYLDDPKRLMNPELAPPRMENGAGWGGFFGSLGGVLVGSLFGVGGAMMSLLSIIGGGAGARYAAPDDRKSRATIGGAAGGIVGPAFAALGGYIGGRHPDKGTGGSGKKSNGATRRYYKFIGRDKRAYRWSDAELEDTILESEAWDNARSRIKALQPGQSITIAGEKLTRESNPGREANPREPKWKRDGHCCSACAKDKPCAGKGAACQVDHHHDHPKPKSKRNPRAAAQRVAMGISE